MEMLIVAREKPRRPWYRKRAARAIKAYEQTLAAVPDVPNVQAHTRAGAQDSAETTDYLPKNEL